MTSLYKLDKGTETEFFRMLHAEGFTAEDAKKLSQNPMVVKTMLAAMRQDETFRLLHGMWTPFDDLVETVRNYDNVSGSKIDAALKTAKKNGTMDMINRLKLERTEGRLVAPVITVNRATVRETSIFARSCIEQTWADRYEWWDRKVRGRTPPCQVIEPHIELIRGAHFVPDEVAIRIVDFAANFNGWETAVQGKNAGSLAGFEVIFAVDQHPGWVKQMNGRTVPYVRAGALLLIELYSDQRVSVAGVNYAHDQVYISGHVHHSDSSIPVVLNSRN